MRKYMHLISRISPFGRCIMACCMMVLLAYGSQAQKSTAVKQTKAPKWIDWTIEYKGELSGEEKLKLHRAIESYVKDQLVAQKKNELAKNLHLDFTESGNAIRVTCDGSQVATGSIVVGPPPPPPPIIPNDKLKTLNGKLISIRGK
ncbi:MAG: hypothetical protein INR73_25430 [Williamsia sp.]|nr:hypothetical protein [Williamsia sp.]